MVKTTRGKWLIGAAALLASGAAFAHDRGSFRMSEYFASATITPDPPRVLATCQDTSGNTYTNVAVSGSGPITSSDPRMSGIFHVNAMILTDQNGIGVSRDKWTITDPATGAVKATGVAQALDADQTGPIIAINTARLADGSFVSHIATVKLPSAETGGKLIIEYGGAVPSDPGRAVIMSGMDCGGYFAANEDGYKPRHGNRGDDDDHGRGHGRGRGHDH